MYSLTLRSLYRSPDGDLQRDLGIEQIRQVLTKPEGILWLDVQLAPSQVDELSSLLDDLFKFHPLAIEDALIEQQAPRVDDWGNYLYVNLPVLDLREDHGLRTNELDLFVGQQYLVSIHEEKLGPLDHLWDQCERVSERHLKGGADHLLYELCDAIVDDYMPLVDCIDDDIDALEAEIFRSTKSALISAIFRTRRTLLKLRRVLGGLRELVSRLARDDHAVIRTPERVYFRDIYDHLVRLYDIVEGLRDVASGALESYMSVTSNRLNGVMRTLTIVTVLFMPLTFLSGFFGMNFFGDSFNVKNPFNSKVLFAVSMVLMVVTPLLMLWWMRRQGWLDPVIDYQQHDESDAAGPPSSAPAERRSRRR